MAKPKKNQKANLYLVGWRDACDAKDVWLTLKEMTPGRLGLNICYSVGWLVGEVDGHLVMAGTAGADEPDRNMITEMGGVHSIPLPWVLFMKKLSYKLPKKYHVPLVAAPVGGAA